PNQPTYFGFAFDSRGHLIVSEPFGASPTIPASPASAVSTFSINSNNTLTQISASIPNGEGTSCWVVLNGRYAYIANNATSNITSYFIGTDGTLTLVQPEAGTGNLVNDMAIAHDGASTYLYVVNAGDGTIGGFQINADATLTSLGTFAG